MHEAEKNPALTSFSTASAPVSGLIRCESAKCPFPGTERKTPKREIFFLSLPR